MRLKNRIYLVEEDVRYYQEKFNAKGSDPRVLTDPDFLGEFLRYADFIEKEFSYRIQVLNFPQVFLTRMVNSKGC